MIYPSIDLMNGKVVQLVQGNPDNKEIEEDNPLEFAKKFSKYSIQLIDLDAALGKGENMSVIQELCNAYDCRVGGGIRTIDKAEELINLGAQKIIIGSSAFKEGKLHTEFLTKLTSTIEKESIIIAIDSKEGKIVIKGWTESTNLDPVDIIKQLEPYCDEVLYTHVDKEGMMQGTDIEILKQLKNATNLTLTAAGGISSKEEIDELEKLGINSVLGMALYKGKINL